MKYRFLITEYLRRTVVVEADSQDEALDKLISSYEGEDIVLDWNDYDGNDIDYLEETNDEADIR